MKLNKANTQLGVTFNVVEFEPSDILRAVQTPDSLARITECVNADRRQKVALVDGRYDLSTKLNKNDLDGKPFDPPGLGFQRKTKGTGDDIEWEWTDNEHIRAFSDAIVDGQFTVDGLVIPPGDKKVKEAAVLAYLQSHAEKCGDSIVQNGQINGTAIVGENGSPVPDGTTCYVLDLARTVRKGGVGPAIPKWALEAADEIIKNGAAERSRTKHLAGYTNSNGIVIDPIVCGELQHPHQHATPEEKEAVHQHNRKAVAKWCAEARRQENDKRSKNAVVDFA